MYNKKYNKIRFVCCRNILNYIEKRHPDEIMAINQILVIASLDNIHRHGEISLWQSECNGRY